MGCLLLYGCLYKSNVVVVIKVGACIHGAECLFCVRCLFLIPLDNMTISTCILFQAMPTLDVSAVDTTLARNEGIENGSDLHLPNFNLADKLRTTISAGADAVKQGVKKGTAAVRIGADAVKNKEHCITVL